LKRLFLPRISNLFFKEVVSPGQARQFSSWPPRLSLGRPSRTPSLSREDAYLQRDGVVEKGKVFLLPEGDSPRSRENFFSGYFSLVRSFLGTCSSKGSCGRPAGSGTDEVFCALGIGSSGGNAEIDETFPPLGPSTPAPFQSFYKSLHPPPSISPPPRITPPFPSCLTPS